MVDFDPDKADLGSWRAEFWLVRATIGHERADLWPERTEFWA